MKNQKISRESSAFMAEFSDSNKTTGQNDEYSERNLRDGSKIIAINNDEDRKAVDKSRFAKTAHAQKSANDEDYPNNKSGAAMICQEKSSKKNMKRREISDADRDLLREVFEATFLRNRAKILRENFLRGIAFGFGTFLGGTIVVASTVWILSFATDLFPWIDRFSQDLIRALEK